SVRAASHPLGRRHSPTERGALGPRWISGHNVSSETILSDAMATLQNFLRTAPWAAALSQEQLQRLEREVTERSIPADGYLSHRGEPATHWIGVIDGLVKLQMSSADGKPVTFTGVA